MQEHRGRSVSGREAQEVVKELSIRSARLLDVGAITPGVVAPLY